MKPEEVPDDVVDAFCRKFWGAPAVALTDSAQNIARETLAAVLPVHAEKVRSVALIDAWTAVTKLQMADADRYADSGGHGSWCLYGDSRRCHGAEAHATGNRVLAALKKLRGAQ